MTLCGGEDGIAVVVAGEYASGEGCDEFEVLSAHDVLYF
jgi:hypothetical protein